MAGISISKSLTYAVASPPVGIDVSKASGYAVLVPFVAGLAVTKTSAYAVLIQSSTVERVEFFILE